MILLVWLNFSQFLVNDDMPVSFSAGELPDIRIELHRCQHPFRYLSKLLAGYLMGYGK